MATNDISPFRQGQTYPPAHWQFQDKLGNVVSLPSGCTYTLYIYNPATNVTIQGQGTWSVVNLATGQVDYNWSPTDSATPGSYEIYAGFTIPNTSPVQQAFTLVVPWQVIPINYQQ